jgi:hypothetical protein
MIYKGIKQEISVKRFLLESIRIPGGRCGRKSVWLAGFVPEA